jgi:hypothetical protein
MGRKECGYVGRRIAFLIEKLVRAVITGPPRINRALVANVALKLNRPSIFATSDLYFIKN